MVEGSVSISTIDLLKLIGISSLISGGSSTIISYLMRIKELTKKNRAEFIQSRLNLYSYFIFQLDKMLLEMDAEEEAGVFDPDWVMLNSDWAKDTIKKIDDMIQDKLHLLNYDILAEWIKVKTFAGLAKTGIVANEESNVNRTREMLVVEYNDVLVPEYGKIVGKGVQTIPSRRQVKPAG